MCGLAGICSRHGIEARRNHYSTESDDYPFWSQHLSIDRRLDAISGNLFQHLGDSPHSQEPSASIVHLNFCAVTIYLHEIAIEKAMGTSTPESLTNESVKRCEITAEKIASIIGEIQNQDSLKVSI